MKKIITKVFTYIIKPFYGSGIGKYPPFYQINKFYQKLSINNSSVFNTKYGFKMELDGSKYIDKELIFSGIWEKI